MKILLAYGGGGRVRDSANFGGEIPELLVRNHHATLHSENCSDLHRVGLWEAHDGIFSPQTYNPTL